jgi:ABC-type transport system involved in cytochrome bd biosynthesis fused ATPase/permease subunit
MDRRGPGRAVQEGGPVKATEPSHAGEDYAVEVRDLVTEFGGGTLSAVDQVSFAVNRGRSVASSGRTAPATPRRSR